MRRSYEVRNGTDKRVIDERIDVMGRAMVEAVLGMSAAGVAGPKRAGWAQVEGEALGLAGK